jgi:hypothetical protein
MNAITDPVTGTVTLRGIVVGLETPVAAAFVEDVCRHIETIISAEALRQKYGLSDDDAWAGLATNEELQRLVGARKEKRIRDGTAAREKAAHLFLAAPDVLSTIMTDATASPRHRVDACRELRATAQVGSENKPADGERIRISINFGTSKTRVDAPMKTIKPEHETLIEARHNEDEYEPFDRDF